MTVFHLHIPRTGGVSVRLSLARGFGEQGVVQFESATDDVTNLRNKPNINLVTGHYNWGLHRAFTTEFTYFVVLRHPVERVASVYYYVRSNQSHKHYARFSRTPLESLLRDAPPALMMNAQARQLAGETTSASLLDLAWAHISDPSVVVTFTDRINDGLLQLGARTGVYFDPLRRKYNAAKRAPLSESEVKLIVEHNRLDLELYTRARSEFLDRLDRPKRLPTITPERLYAERIAWLRKRAEQSGQLQDGRFLVHAALDRAKKSASRSLSRLKLSLRRK